MNKGVRLIHELLAFQKACARLGEIPTGDLVFVSAAAVLREVSRAAAACAKTAEEIDAELRQEATDGF